jgi:2'-5' RNA ligase
MRMFVAADVSSDIIGRSKKLIAKLEKAGVDARWTTNETMHLSLKFLGEVKDNRTMEVCQAVERSVCGVEPFTFSCLGAGGFPHNERPRVLWMGIDDGREELCALQARVEDELAAIGFRHESRTYSPHLTIGRMRRSKEEATTIGETLGELVEFDGGEAVVDELVLYASYLDRRVGATYEVLGRVRIPGEA